jgi:PBP1b-binding outer membrane lipoprotein LpoB
MMRKGMYRWLSLIMILSMLLSSCSKSAETPVLDEPEITAPAVSEEPADEPEDPPQYLEYSEPIES